MQFNLGNVPAQSRVSNRLAANAIHTVKFDGATAEVIEGKDTTKYSVLKLKFTGEDGEFIDTIFEPKDDDNIRKQNNFGYENPSRVEELMFKVRHLIAAVNPKVSESIDKKGKMEIATWKDLQDFVIKHTTTGVGKETQIKLLADSKGNPQFPPFVLGISKAGEPYPRTNFIGDKLAFTAKEQERINNALTAKPTNIEAKVGAPAVTLTSDELDIDIDDI